MKQLAIISIFLVYTSLSANPLNGISPYSTQIEADCLQILHQDPKFAFSYSYVHVYNQNGTFDDRYKQYTQDSIKAGFKLMAEFQFCPLKDPFQQASQFAQKGNANLFDIIWLGASTNTQRNCMWNLLNPQQSCNYIKKLKDFFESLGKEVGIISSQNDWKAIFDNTCSELGNLKLFVFSADAFQPFGGWSNYTVTRKFHTKSSYCPGHTGYFYEIL